MIIKAADFEKLAAGDHERGAGDPMPVGRSGDPWALKIGPAGNQEILAKRPIQFGSPAPGHEVKMTFSILVSHTASNDPGNRVTTQALQLRMVDVEESGIRV
jgi:hypothetical protein